MKKNQFSLFLKGALILTMAGLFSRFLGFFYKIFLAQALGAKGMGIYQLIFPIFSVCHAITASGMETAISRFTAFEKKEEASSYLFAGLSISLLASAIVSILLWNYAEFISIQFLHEKSCAPLLKILSISIPLSTIHCCFAGAYLGKKKAHIPAIAQLLEQFARMIAVYALYCIYIDKNLTISPNLAVFGLLAGEIASSLFVLTVSNEKYPHFPNSSAYFTKCRTLLQMALPLTANRLSLTLLQSVEAVLIPLSLQKSGLSNTEALSIYGILTGMSLSFIMFPNAITSSISAMLLPTISEEQAKGNHKQISNTIEYTILFGLIIGTFCMGIFLRFGKDLGILFFQEPLAGHFLVTLAWICPVLYLSGNLQSILHGLGLTHITFFNQLASISVRILFILLFAPKFGIEGILWGLLASQFLLCFLGLKAIFPYLTLTYGLDYFLIKPFAAILFSIKGVDFLNRIFPNLHFSLEIINLIIQIGVIGLLYLMLLFSFGLWKVFKKLTFTRK